MRTIAILGADTALGRALVERLQEREVEADVRPAALTENIGPGLVAIDEALLAAGDLFVLAFSGPMANGIAEGLDKLGKPLLDLREEVSADLPLIWPGVDPEASAQLAEHGHARIAPGLSSPLVAVGAALAEVAPTRMTVATYESAARFGQPGMDELSAQVRGVFTMNTPDPELFTASLAFDAIPWVAPTDGDPEDAEAQLEDDVAAGLAALGAGEVEVSATRVLVPSFSAEGAVVEVEAAEALDDEAVEKLIAGARTLRRADRDPLPSLDAVGRDDALVGRIRVRGRRVRLWLVADRLLRGSATQAALAIEGWLDRD